MIVDMKSKGVTVRPIPNIIGAHYFNEIFFKDVHIPAENLVGKENNGWRQLMQALAFERGIALGASGRCRRLLDELVQFAKENGSLKRPEIRQKLADLAIDISTLRILALEAAWKASKNEMVVYEPSRDKAFNDEVMERMGILGTEIIGAYSQVDPMADQNRWRKVKGMMEGTYWGAPGMAIAAGTTDTMRNIVAQFGLGLPRGY
jgi:alkylation response protein AidB-like acyl-CoA dehydrogenase